MNTDPLDQPDEPRYELAVPFIACTSQGGPHDDAAFVAGFECGALDARLVSIAAAGGHSLHATVRTDNVPQLELIAMNRGFPNLDRTDHDGEHTGWSSVILTANQPL